MSEPSLDGRILPRKYPVSIKVDKKQRSVAFPTIGPEGRAPVTVASGIRGDHRQGGGP